MSFLDLIGPVIIGWIVVSVLVAAGWCLLMTRLPHPDDFLAAPPASRADVDENPPDRFAA
jgi:hypothetical protein